VTQANAHPHTSCAADFAIVHNGIIANYRHLREELASEGHELRSSTDTETIVHLVEKYYRSMGSLERAFVLQRNVDRPRSLAKSVTVG
jgi:glucosamine 6-phosphate synthetase-like amidotransferase/phosphosugar isomerase protein